MQITFVALSRDSLKEELESLGSLPLFSEHHCSVTNMTTTSDSTTTDCSTDIVERAREILPDDFDVYEPSSDDLAVKLGPILYSMELEMLCDELGVGLRYVGRSGTLYFVEEDSDRVVLTRPSDSDDVEEMSATVTVDGINLAIEDVDMSVEVDD